MTRELISPHGGRLVDLIVDEERRAELISSSHRFVSWDLTPRQLCDLELLLNGGFSPLRGFMNQSDYESVLSDMKLADGTLWPIPVMLDLPSEMVKLFAGSVLGLRDPEGVLLAVLHVEEIWTPDREREAMQTFGTVHPEHPGVVHLINGTNLHYVGGRLEGLQLPVHYDFRPLRLKPAETRRAFGDLGWDRVIAFQTRNPMHRAHFELTLRASRENDAKLLINPVVGMTKPGDIDHYTRVRAYQAILHRYPPHSAMLALLPLAMRMAGPREAIWHAIVRKNYGCTHLIVGRDHAGPGEDSSGVAFYDPYQAQEALSKVEGEVGVQMVPFKTMAYVEELDSYLPENELPKEGTVLRISGSKLRKNLAEGREIPSWFSFPEVVEKLRRTHPPRESQGLTVFFTGLSGSGKSTIANVLMVKLLEKGDRRVTLLDGDLIRKQLSSELGFSKEHRDLNIMRIGYVASEITKHGGLAICAPIAPYDEVRRHVRQMVARWGGFFLVYVNTPLEVCEQRDRKGLYARARAGILKEFTGISDPYEPPTDADCVIDTLRMRPEEAANEIMHALEDRGYLARSSSRT